MSIAVDLDGTLAYYEKGQFPKIGNPIMPIMLRVVELLDSGKEVVIFTARIHKNPDQIANIRSWLIKQSTERNCPKLANLEITNLKTPEMTEFWDDRSIQVLTNRGKFVL